MILLACGSWQTSTTAALRSLSTPVGLLSRATVTRLSLRVRSSAHSPNHGSGHLSGARNGTAHLQQVGCSMLVVCVSASCVILNAVAERSLAEQ